jgi:hypothetical protein
MATATKQKPAVDAPQADTSANGEAQEKGGENYVALDRVSIRAHKDFISKFGKPDVAAWAQNLATKAGGKLRVRDGKAIRSLIFETVESYDTAIKASGGMRLSPEKVTKLEAKAKALGFDSVDAYMDSLLG